MTTFLTSSELDSIRAIAELGMATDIEVLRLVDTDIATGSQQTWVHNSYVKAWVFSTPTPMITIVSGAQALVNTYRLFLPVGTDIQTGDRIKAGGETYTVSDTTGESTWLPLLSVSLRKVE